MTRYDEQTDERLRTEDLVRAGDTHPADQDEFRPTNDDFRSTEDDHNLSMDGEHASPHADPFDGRETAHTEAAGLDPAYTDPVPDRQELRDPDLDTVDRDPDRSNGFVPGDRQDSSALDTVDTSGTRGAADDTMDEGTMDGHADHSVDTVDEHQGNDLDDTMDGGYGAEAPAEPVAETEEPPPAAMPSNAGDEVRQLFRPEDVERFRSEWLEVQTMFVDDPRDAVRGADHLVAAVMQSLASTFNEHKHELEGHWQEGTEVQTEELRIALRRYRSFFNQLLDV